MLKIDPVTLESLSDLTTLFCTDEAAERCWCMWFIIGVKDFHAAGAEGNKNSFINLITKSSHPLGLIAYENDVPIGWCALGPRARFARAIKTPTYRGRDKSEDKNVWLVPCFFIRPDKRGSSTTQKLLQAAVNLARENGAIAVEGFPYAGQKRRHKDLQVGFEVIFESLGFKVIRKPSANRHVMRLDF